MITESVPSEKAKHSDTLVPCKYCLDDIHAGAQICKSCNEPLTLRRRAARFISTALTSLVALGSLGVAYLQYNDAHQAQREKNDAQQAEAATSKASQLALDHLVSHLDPNAQRQLRQTLSRTYTTNVTTLAAKIQANPTNTALRSAYMLRQFAVPEEKQ